MIKEIVRMPNSVTNEEFYQLFTGENAHKKYVFGINQYSDEVVKHFKMDGYIDDFSKEQSKNGLPIFKLSEIDNTSLVLSCISSIHLNSAQIKLKLSGFKNIGHYITLANLDRELKQVEQLSDSRTSYALYENEFLWTATIFADQESRQLYKDILDFRVNANIESMRNCTYCVQQQYFPSLLSLDQGEVFIDGGGFDGETSIEFIKRCPEYSAIHIFEPGKKSFDGIRQSLGEYENIHFHNEGLYDTVGTIGFDSSGGSHSQILANDAKHLEKIHITSLDLAVPGPVTFVKLDIEGSELRALHGMQRHILEDHPKLAIAVYHRANDFWQIPKYVLGLRKDYQVYLRHYTEGWSETVMYFIPR